MIRKTALAALLIFSFSMTGYAAQEQTEGDSADEHFLAYLLGEEKDAEGELFWAAGEEDVEYALRDLNGDGQNELIVRLYGYWIPGIFEYRDNKIESADITNIGSAGVTFLNTKNQFVSGDTTHASREQYWISEIDKQGDGKTVLYFASMWDDWAKEEGRTDYYVCEDPEEEDFTTDDCRKISRKEYEDLLEEYTQEEPADWIKVPEK